MDGKPVRRYGTELATKPDDADWYADYDAADCENPTGPQEGELRVLRGGAWHNHPINCRASYRNRNHPTNGNDNIGFRLVRVAFAAKTH